MKILVTGAAGYIGSHAALNFMQNTHEVVIFDNLEIRLQNVIVICKLIVREMVKRYCILLFDYII